MLNPTPPAELPNIDETNIPLVDPYKGDYINDPPITNQYAIALEEDVWLSLPPQGQALFSMPNGEARVQAFETAVTAGDCPSDEPIFGLNENIWTTIHLRQMYRDRYGFDWAKLLPGCLMSTDRKDYPRWTPPKTPRGVEKHLIGAAEGMYSVSATAKIPWYAVLAGDANPVGKPTLDPVTGVTFMKIVIAPSSLIQQEPVLGWVSLKDWAAAV